MGKAVIPKQVPYYESRIRKYRHEVRMTGYKDSFPTVIKLLKLLKKDKLQYTMIEDPLQYTITWQKEVQ